MTSRRRILIGMMICAYIALHESGCAQAAETLSEVRAIAREAYVYGFPLVDNYRAIYKCALDQGETEFNSSSNRKLQRLGAGEPWSIVALDLRAEPQVLTLPQVGAGRSDVVKLVDLATLELASIGTGKSGRDGGSYLLAGPNWKGAVPEGVQRVLRSETELALVLFRTELSTPTDLENLPQRDTGFELQPLSAYVGTVAPSPARQIKFIEPLSVSEERTTLAFFNQLAFVLQFCPTRPSEAALRNRLATIGIVPGQPFGGVFLSEGTKSALMAGMQEGQREIDARRKQLPTLADELEPENEFSGGPDAEFDTAGDAFMIPFTVDAGGELLDGRVHRYTLTFRARELPPAHGGWSLAMYELPDQLPVKNAIDRYDVNSQMLGDMVTNNDGGLTIRIQKNPPGDDTDANWLPAPGGPFLMILRLYRPSEAVRFNAWEAPAVERVD